MRRLVGTGLAAVRQRPPGEPDAAQFLALYCARLQADGEATLVLVWDKVG